MATNKAPAERKARIYETHDGVYEVEWPTAGKRTYTAITSLTSRRDGSTLPAERLSIYSDSTDAELDEARKALAHAHNVVVGEIKRRAEAPKAPADPRDAAIARLEAEIAALKAQATPTPAPKAPAAKASSNGVVKAVAKAPAQPKTAEQEMADLPF